MTPQELDCYREMDIREVPQAAYSPTGQDWLLFVLYAGGPDWETDCAIENALGRLSNGSGTFIGQTSCNPGEPVRDLSFYCTLAEYQELVFALPDLPVLRKCYLSPIGEGHNFESHLTEDGGAEGEFHFHTFKNRG